MHYSTEAGIAWSYFIRLNEVDVVVIDWTELASPRLFDLSVLAL
jgi:hypothetical protein